MPEKIEPILLIIDCDDHVITRQRLRDLSIKEVEDCKVFEVSVLHNRIEINEIKVAVSRKKNGLAEF